MPRNLASGAQNVHFQTPPLSSNTKIYRYVHVHKFMRSSHSTCFTPIINMTCLSPSTNLSLYPPRIPLPRRLFFTQLNGMTLHGWGSLPLLCFIPSHSCVFPYWPNHRSNTFVVILVSSHIYLRLLLVLYEACIINQRLSIFNLRYFCKKYNS